MVLSTEPEFSLGADDEHGARPGRAVEPREVDIATLHDGEGAGFRDRLVEHPDIVPPAMGDIDEAGDIAPQIQRGMERDRRFRAHERRPGKAREGSAIKPTVKTTLP